MKDWLNLPWWQDKTPLEKETGQYVLNVWGAESRRITTRPTARTIIEKGLVSSASAKESSPKKSMSNGLPLNSLQDEMQLRDALKDQELPAVVVCAGCGSHPVFDRRVKVEADGSVRWPFGFEYRVRCKWEQTNWDDNPCKTNVTPWLPSLDLAVRHWTLSIKLAK